MCKVLSSWLSIPFAAQFKPKFEFFTHITPALVENGPGPTIAAEQKVVSHLLHIARWVSIWAIVAAWSLSTCTNDPKLVPGIAPEAGPISIRVELCALSSIAANVPPTMPGRTRSPVTVTLLNTFAFEGSPSMRQVSLILQVILAPLAWMLIPEPRTETLALNT